MLTASLVVFKHTLRDIRPVVDGCLAAECCRKLYIVDNGNDPELAEDIKNLDCSKLEYIPSRNVGFGAGHNIAMRKMLDSSSLFHAILNPDVLFQPGTFEMILQFMQKNPQTGLVMPKTLYPDGSMQYNCKFIPSPMDLIAKRFFPEILKKNRMRKFMMQEFDHEKILHVPYLCGCFMVFSKNALQCAGLFDERFFMYPEDIDITRRIFSAGFHTIYFPHAEIIHAHGQASYKKIKMLFIHISNMCRYFNKWGWFSDRERREINKKIKQLNPTAKMQKQ